MKTFLKIFLSIVLTLPLAIYPFLLIANVMSIAAEPSRVPAPFMTKLSANGFLWTSTLYPLAYVLTMIACFIDLLRKKSDRILLWLVILFGYLLIVGAFFVGWIIFSI